MLEYNIVKTLPIPLFERNGVELHLPQNVDEIFVLFNNRNAIRLWKFNNNWYHKKTKIELNLFFDKSINEITTIIF